MSVLNYCTIFTSFLSENRCLLATSKDPLPGVKSKNLVNDRFFSRWFVSDFQVCYNIRVIWRCKFTVVQKVSDIVTTSVSQNSFNVAWNQSGPTDGIINYLVIVSQVESTATCVKAIQMNCLPTVSQPSPWYIYATVFLIVIAITYSLDGSSTRSGFNTL
jgi:hypothetical protein